MSDPRPRRLPHRLRLTSLAARVRLAWRAGLLADRGETSRKLAYGLALGWLVASAAVGGLRTAAVGVWEGLPLPGHAQLGPDARAQYSGPYYSALHALQRQLPRGGKTVAVVIAQRPRPGTWRRYGSWLAETTYRLYPTTPDYYLRADSGGYQRASPASPDELTAGGPGVWEHDYVVWCEDPDSTAPRSYALVYENRAARVYPEGGAMMEVLAVGLALGGIWLLGAALLDWLGLRRRRSLGGAQFAIDFAVGNGALAVLWIAAALVGAQIRPWTLWGAALALAGLALARRARGSGRGPAPVAPSPPPPAPRWPAFVVLGLFALVVAGRSAIAYVTPMYSDGRLIWAFKAKVMFVRGGMTRDAFSSDALARYRYTALDHPPALPALQVAAYHAMGRIDERAAKLVGGVYWLGIAAVLVCYLRRRFALPWALLLALLAIQTPVLAYHATGGAADVALAFCLLTASLLLADWVDWGRREEAVQAALLFGIGALMKPEGSSMALGGALLFLALARRRRLGARERLLPAVAMIAPLAPWMVLRVVWRIPSLQLAAARVPELFAFLDRLSAIGQAVAYQVRAWNGWELTWWFVAIGFLAFLWSGRRERSVTALWLLLLWQVMVFATVYLTCPYNINWYLDASLHRVLLQLMPLGLAVAAASLAPPLLRTPEPRPADAVA